MSQVFLVALAAVVYVTITRQNLAALAVGIISAATFGALAGTTVVATGLASTLMLTLGSVGFYVLGALLISRRTAEAQDR